MKQCDHCGRGPREAYGLCKRCYTRDRRAGLLNAPTCSVDGCDAPAEARGLCHRDHMRAWRSERKRKSLPDKEIQPS